MESGIRSKVSTGLPTPLCGKQGSKLSAFGIVLRPGPGSWFDLGVAMAKGQKSASIAMGCLAGRPWLSLDLERLLPHSETCLPSGFISGINTQFCEIRGNNTRCLFKVPEMCLMSPKHHQVDGFPISQMRTWNFRYKVTHLGFYS